MTSAAYGVVECFERAVADFAGAPHAVAVDCCTNAIFLSCKLLAVKRVTLPARTYISVPAAVIHAGGTVEFRDYDWHGVYQLAPYPIWDSAKRFRRGMYTQLWQELQCDPYGEPPLMCLSFHTKKHLPIGRGGMILTDDADAAAWLRRARYDGRDGKPYHLERVTMLGWHAYMTPEQAARGLALLDVLPSDCPPDLEEGYPDLRQMPVFSTPAT